MCCCQIGDSKLLRCLIGDRASPRRPSKESVAGSMRDALSDTGSIDDAWRDHAWEKNTRVQHNVCTNITPESFSLSVARRYLRLLCPLVPQRKFVVVLLNEVMCATIKNRDFILRSRWSHSSMAAWNAHRQMDWRDPILLGIAAW